MGRRFIHTYIKKGGQVLVLTTNISDLVNTEKSREWRVGGGLARMSRVPVLSSPSRQPHLTHVQLREARHDTETLLPVWLRY